MILPYSKVGGEWSIPDPIMVGLWDKAIKQGVDRKTFRGQSIVDSGQFLALMQTQGILPLLCVDDFNPVCVAWLNSIGEKHGFCHFFFFKEFWGKAEQYGNEILDYWFQLVETIVGILTPDNRLAIQYAAKVGFVRLGEIPHVGVFFYKTRDAHGNRKQQTG